MADVFTLLGFCQRAGKLASGESAAIANLKKGKAKLVIIAEDASERTKESFQFLSNESGATYRVYGQKADLGVAIGKTPRSVITILDQGFGESILKSLPTL